MKFFNLHVRSRPLCLQLVCFSKRRVPGSGCLRLRSCRRLLTSQIGPHFSNAGQKIVSRLPLLLPSVLNNAVSNRAHVHLLWLFLWERRHFCSSFDSRIRTRACQLMMNGMISSAKLLTCINLLLTDDAAEWAETNPRRCSNTDRGRAFWKIIEYFTSIFCERFLAKLNRNIDCLRISISEEHMWFCQTMATPTDMISLAASVTKDHLRWKCNAHRLYQKECTSYAKRRIAWEIQLDIEALKYPEIRWSFNMDSKELLALAKSVKLPKNWRILVESEDVEIESNIEDRTYEEKNNDEYLNNP